jgi:hypothetical protein
VYLKIEPSVAHAAQAEAYARRGMPVAPKLGWTPSRSVGVGRGALGGDGVSYQRRFAAGVVGVREFPTKGATLGLGLFCCAIVAIMGSAVASLRRPLVGKRTGFVVVPSLLVLRLTLMAFGWCRLGTRSDASLRHSRVLTIQTIFTDYTVRGRHVTVTMEHSPEQLGVTSYTSRCPFTLNYKSRTLCTTL